MDLESADALKVKDDELEDTDEPERDTWTGRFDFLLSLLGYSVGLGNVWRFPYLAYNNGGGAFLVPFAIMLVLAGLPLMFMELAFGQYAALGPVAVYNQFSPLFRGLGYGMVIVSTIVMLYYNLIIAWTIWYILASATRVLPWHTCDPEWSSEYCYSYELANECLERNQTYYLGLCHNLTEGIIPEAALQERHPPAEEYFTNRVLGLSSGIEVTGSVRWEMALCLLAAWIIVFLCLCKGVHSSGKVVYFTALFPYVVLVVLFVRGVTLPGASTGILYYLTPDWSRLANAQVWGDAAVQIFFALSPAWGGLITLSSYNKFSNNCYVDSLIVAASNIATSFFAGLVIFAVIGFLAHELNVSVDKVVDQGAGLAFIVYPEVVTRLPIAPLWSLLFFIMLLTLGLDSQFALMETVTTAILDGFPSLRSRKAWVVFGVAVFGYLGGLIFTTNSGMYWLQLMDKYAANWSVLMLAIMECVLIAWVYGTDRFCADIQLMIGKQSKLWVFFWSCMWRFITPTALIFILVFNWVEYRPARYGAYVYPPWADVLGWTLGLLPVLVVLLMAVAQVCNGPDELNVIQTARMLSQPTREWGAGDAKAMGITDMTGTTGASGTSATTGTTSSTAVLLMRGRAAPRDHQPCMLLPRGSLTRRASQDSNASHEKIGIGSHKPKRHGRKSLAQSLSQDSSDPTVEPLLKEDDTYSETRDKCAKLPSSKMEDNKHYKDVSYTKLPTISTPNRHYSKLESDIEGNQSIMSILSKRRESATKKKIDFAQSTQNDIPMTTFSEGKQSEPSETVEDVVVSDNGDKTSDKALLVNTDSVIFTTAKIHLNSKTVCPMPNQVVVVPVATSFENKSYDPTYKLIGPAKDAVDKNTRTGVAQNSKCNIPESPSREKKSGGIEFQETRPNLTKVSSKSITPKMCAEPILMEQDNSLGRSDYSGPANVKPFTTATHSELKPTGNVKPITTTVANLDVVKQTTNAKTVPPVDSASVTNNSAILKSVETTKYVTPTSCKLVQALTSKGKEALKTNKPSNSSPTSNNVITIKSQDGLVESTTPIITNAVNSTAVKVTETKPTVAATPTQVTNIVEANSTYDVKSVIAPVDNLVDDSLNSYKTPAVVPALPKLNSSNNERPSSKPTKIPQIKYSVTKPVIASAAVQKDTKTPLNIESVTTPAETKVSAKLTETDISKPETSIATNLLEDNSPNKKPDSTIVSNLVKETTITNTKSVCKVPATPAKRKSPNLDSKPANN